MREKENTTALDAAKMMVSGNLEFEKVNHSKFHGKSAVAHWTYKDDNLSERHENLLERFPAKDIGDIRKLENTLDTFDSSDIDMEEVSELCLENDIVPSEILLLDVMFTNELKTASRNGITVLNIDGSLEIRNGKEKFLSPKEADLIRAYIVGGDDNDLAPGFRGGVDWSTSPDSYSSVGGANTKTKNSFQGKIDSVNIEFSANDKMKLKSEYNGSN